MASSKQLFNAAEMLKAMAATASDEIVREALEDARAKVVIRAAEQLAWEIDQARRVA